MDQGILKLAAPHIPAEGIREVVKVLASGNLVQGEYVLLFEEALQDYQGIGHAVLVSSGTAALHLSLLALGITDGDEVIVPAFTFPAPANMVEVCAATPVLVDIGLDDFCVDAAQVEKKITTHTKALVLVHEFGQAAALSPILEIAKRRHLAVIEDAACALGTQYHGQKAGTFGDLGCFSFHPRKILTTGEGGLVVTGNRKTADRIRSLRNHGITSMNGKNDFLSTGLNYRMTDFQAAAGHAQLPHLEKMIEKRIALASIYDKALAGLENLSLPGKFNGRRHIYQTYHVLLNEGIDRDRMIAAMNRHGIETNLGAQALHDLSFYKKKYGFTPGMYPNALKAFRSGLALPLYPQLEEKDIIKVIHALEDSLNELR